MIYKQTKQHLQNLVIEQKLELYDFTFFSPESSTYIIKYKEDDYSFQISDFGTPPTSPLKLFIYKGHQNTLKEHQTNWDGVYRQFNSWLRLIKVENSTSLHEEQYSFREFSQNIKDISTQFPFIYNQSLRCESMALNEISGMGFRKAFEYLIKDYLVHSNKMTIEEAKTTFKLMVCIEHLRENDLMFNLARLAANLGNDFSHYDRKMTDKEIPDLKELINTLVAWIDNEAAYKKQIESLSDSSRKIIDTF